MNTNIRKILHVDLNRKTFREEELSEELVKKFLGGPGFAINYMIKKQTYNFSHFSPDNPFILMTGLLTGTTYPCSGFYSVSSRSPLTEIYGEGLSGGFFGAELRRSLTGIIFKNRSTDPVYLVINEDSYELKDASDIWGLNTKKTFKILREKLSKDYKIACIGPSGEQLMPIASILNDHYRAVGRGGMGAIMGGKKLKAIAVKSRKKIAYYDSKKFHQITKLLFKEFSNSAMATTLKQIGTNAIDYFEMFADVPHQNWGALGKWKGVHQISGAVVREKMMVRLRPCYLCPFSCGREVEIKEGSYKIEEASGPEYETVAAFGSMCLNVDIESIAYLNDYCNQMGVDTISTGCTVAFAIDCFENGILTEEDIGFPIHWGDSASIVELTKMICLKKGIGAILSEGTRKAAKVIGKGADQYTAEIKGLDLPMHDPRANFPLGLQYATSNRGACHLRGFGTDIYGGFSNLSKSLGIKEEVPIKLRTIDNPEFASDISTSQNASEINNALGICRQTISSGTLILENLFEYLLDSIYYLTGIKYDIKELMIVGERIFTLKRLFNVKCGTSKKDDKIPIKLETPLNRGRAKGKVLKIDSMLQEYYKIRGWDEQGRPTPERLKELDIEP